MSHRKGITLIELLVYIGVGTILMLAMSAFAFSTLATHNQADAYTSLTQESLSTLERMRTLVTRSYKLDPSSQSLSDLTKSGARLVLRNRDSASDPIIFFVTDNVLYVQKGSGTAMPMHGKEFQVAQLQVVPLSSSDGRSTNLQMTFSLAMPVTGIGATTARTTYTTSFECADYGP